MRSETKYVQTDLLRIAYREYGAAEGTPLVLLHGFPYDIHAYDEVCRLLVSGPSAPHWHIYVPWLRGYGETSFLSPDTTRSGEQSALAHDLVAFMDALGLEKAYLAGFDWGGRAACVTAAVFPDRVLGLVSCGAGYNVHDPQHWQEPLAPQVEIRSWYMYYLNTERGRNALLTRRDEFCRYLWKIWSPDWAFTEEEYQRSAESFRNPDFADIVCHSYRCRIGQVPEDPRYEKISSAIAAQPPIRVPSVVLLGRSDSVTPPPSPDTNAPHFTGFYECRVLTGIGHNVPQEAPAKLADAIRTVYAHSSGR